MKIKFVLFILVLTFFILRSFFVSFDSAFIVLGQAHFIITYYYIYKYSKSSFRKILFFLSVIIITFLMHYFFGPSDYFIFFVLSFFTIHFFLDEIKHLNINLTYSMVTYLVGIILMYLVTIGADYRVLETSWSQRSCIGLSFLLFAPLATRDLKGNLKYYTYFSLFIPLPLIRLFNMFDIEYLLYPMAFLAIYHYISWYVYSYQKNKKSRFLRKELLISMTFVNIVIILLFLAKIPNFHNYAFKPYNFYIWTLFHLVITVRSVDYREVVSSFYIEIADRDRFAGTEGFKV